jgi:CBS domain containing-hemolysin-like protein
MADDTHSPAPDPLGPGESQRPEGLFERLKHLIGLKSSASLRKDLKDALAEHDGDSVFSPLERAMLENVLGLRELRVADVMVPRADIIAVAADTSLATLLRVFRTASHSRLPVYGETLDDPKGMLHIRDFLDFLAASAEAGAAKRKRRNTKETTAFDLGNVDLALTLASTKLLRPVLYAPPSMPALDLLVRMQATRTHIALVIDEYGGTDGLVSIEDLVEMIVGDIEDEHDETGVAIQSSPGGYFIIEARATLEEVGEALGTNFELHEAAEDVDTIGGYLATLAGRVPSRGELIGTPNDIEFEVIDADPRRIKRVRVQMKAKKTEDRPERRDAEAGLDNSAAKPVPQSLSAERGNEKAI